MWKPLIGDWGYLVFLEPSFNCPVLIGVAISSNIRIFHHLLHKKFRTPLFIYSKKWYCAVKYGTIFLPAI